MNSRASVIQPSPQTGLGFSLMAERVQCHTVAIECEPLAAWQAGTSSRMVVYALAAFLDHIQDTSLVYVYIPT